MARRRATVVGAAIIAAALTFLAVFNASLARAGDYDETPSPTATCTPTTPPATTEPPVTTQPPATTTTTTTQPATTEPPTTTDPPTTEPPVTTEPPTTTPADRLPVTGPRASLLIPAGVALVILGALVVVAARRWRTR